MQSRSDILTQPVAFKVNHPFVELIALALENQLVSISVELFVGQLRSILGMDFAEGVG